MSYTLGQKNWLESVFVCLFVCRGGTEGEGDPQVGSMPGRDPNTWTPSLCL